MVRHAHRQHQHTAYARGLNAKQSRHQYKKANPLNSESRINRNAEVDVNLTYSWTGSHRQRHSSAPSRSRSSDSETISILTTAVGSTGSLTVTVSSGTGYTIGSSSSATTTISMKLLARPTQPSKPSLTSVVNNIHQSVPGSEPSSLLPIDQYTLRYRENGTQQWTGQTVDSTSLRHHRTSPSTPNTTYRYRPTAPAVQ